MSEKTLAEVSSEFGKQDSTIKKATPLKDAAKKEMFAKFDELVEPEEILVVIEHDNLDLAEKEALKRYPAFELDASRETDHGFEMILREKPYLKGFTYVNPDDETVYGRTQRAGKTYLDDEALRDDDPDLWERVSEVPNSPDIVALMRSLSIDYGALDEPWDELWTGPREFVGLQNITDPEDLAAVQMYLYEGEPTVAVTAPRPAKPEELEGLDEQ